MANYFTVEDLEQYYQLQNPFLKSLKLSRNLKSVHNISGWVNLTMTICDGRDIPIADIWTGFRFEHLDDFNKVLFDFCRRNGIQIA